MVTIEDAVKSGAGVLFDIEALKEKYSSHAFKQLFMCEWVDDSDSIFTISQLMKCAIDASKWKDFDPKSSEPFGHREVWGGFDPAHSRDGASFVVIAPPLFEGEKYRLLERHQWHGLSYRYQADRIRELFAKYNFSYIGIDTNGVGVGVYEMIKEFAGRKAVPILYTAESKSALVLKVHDLVERGLLEWNEEEKDIIASFLMIKQTTTNRGKSSTFIADRTASNQHADVFWAMAHAINKRELNDQRKKKARWFVDQ